MNNPTWSYLRKKKNGNGKLTVQDLAVAVVVEGRTWFDVCAEAEDLSGATPGLYFRLAHRLTENRQTFLALQMAALARVAHGAGGGHE